MTVAVDDSAPLRGLQPDCNVHRHPLWCGRRASHVQTYAQPAPAADRRGRRAAPEFAAGFDTAARLLYERTGHLVGWGIDPTPLPPYGSHAGPEPAALRNTESIVAINPFNITSQGPGAFEPEDQITEDERMAYARNVTAVWANSGLPYIATAIPGFDAHLVRPDLARYGFNAGWLRQQQQLAVANGNAGLAFDPVNGFSEGYNIYPTEEDGDTITRWACETVTAHRANWVDI